MNRLILKSRQCPGDIVMLTAAVRDLHKAYPKSFQTDVRTTAPELWENNPYITPLSEGEADVRQLEMHYPLIHHSNERPYHFLHGYVQYLEQKLNLKIPLTQFRGDIHLSAEEQLRPPIIPGVELPDRYWIVMAGGKFDFTAKWWNPKSYAEVVRHFRDRVTFLQCGEAGHWHPRLDGSIDLIGKTSTRDFVRLMHFADGVICPVTFAMHLAAAVPCRAQGPPNRACIVLAGGREPPHWEAYPQHQFLHTIGQLDCCKSGGCWKSRCQKVGDGDSKDRSNLCERPVSVGEDLVVPQCLEMIRPSEVISAIDRTLDGWNRIPVKQSAPPVARPNPMKIKSPSTKAAPVRASRGLVTPGSVLLEFRHGLGDAVQLTAVLRHLRHYHPDWKIDVAALRGKQTAFQGLARRCLLLDDPKRNRTEYEQVHRLDWHECRNSEARWPNTKVTRCLLEVFRLTPIPELCRYSIAIGDDVRDRARDYLASIAGPVGDGERYPVVLLHYEGNTSGDQKNLTHGLAAKVCQQVLAEGAVPVILDWDRRSPVPDGASIHCPDADHPLWMGHGHGDAEVLAALIESSRLMIGVDSGPLHVAGATTTPTIGVWTKHHPVHFFDLSQNVLHLVPRSHAELANGPASVEYFEKAYRFQTYDDLEKDLLEVLSSSLRRQPAPINATRLKKIPEPLATEVEAEVEAPTEVLPAVPKGFTRPLTVTAYNAAYYEEHKQAGLDYLVYGDWQRDYGRWLVESLGWNDKRVLDVGCACGSILKGLAAAGAIASGCDVNETTITLGRSTWPDLASAMHICDAANLHLWDENRFDGIHASQVAEHWPPDLVPRILRELARVTRVGGAFFCCLDTLESNERFGRRIAEEDPTHVCIRPLNWWREQFEQAGWEVVPDVERAPVQEHPGSYLKRYDWDWILARRLSPAAIRARVRKNDPRTVSIVIAARNNGQYLAEAIQSALEQDHPSEVIYADDGSTDNSVDVARSFVDRGLIILEPSGHHGVSTTRNRGATVARGDYLVFLDGDDRLPTGFVSDHLEAMQSGVPFVYGPAAAFGEGPHNGVLWEAQDWDQYDRWQTNTVNTSALYARWAFDAAGGWRELPTMWDWDLALRACRFGKPRRSRATLQYRQHGQSWSHQVGEKGEKTKALLLGEIRRVNARLSIGAILSGRLPDFFPEWIEALVYSVRCMTPAEKPELVLLDNSRSASFAQTLRAGLAPYGSTFSSIRVIPYDVSFEWRDETSRRDGIADFMAKASGRLSRELRGDIAWFVEDDILLPHLAGRELWRTLTEGWHPPAAVGGCYRNRHVPEQYVGGWWRSNRSSELRKLPETGSPFEVDFTGTGCLMFWRHYSVESWQSHCRGVPAHDWAWCEAVRAKGRRILMHPAVRCGHVRSVGDVIVG